MFSMNLSPQQLVGSAWKMTALPHDFGQNPLCAVTISAHCQQAHCVLMENPISLHEDRMLMGITKYLSA